MKVLWHTILVTSLLGLAACGQENGAPAEYQPGARSTPAVIPIVLPIPHELDADGNPLGFSYIIPIDVDPTVRQLRLFENGKELGPNDAQHSEIREVGMGAYSHYKATDGGLAFYFSTSDNSDPNTNGRVYELR